MPKPARIAERIFDEAFGPANPREPRSFAYKQGVLDALRFRAGEGPSPKECPRYQLWTPEADAWFSGLDEGYSRWKRYQDED